jgi:hypothetical protein
MRRPNEGTSDDPTRETIRDEYQDARTPIVSFFATRLSALRRSPAGMVTPRLDAAGERSKGFLAYVTRRGARSDVGRLGAPIKCAGRGRSPRQFFQRARAGSAAVTGWHLCAEALTQRARGSKGFLDVGNAAGARSRLLGPGRAPIKRQAGLNASSQGELDSFEASIGAYQERLFRWARMTIRSTPHRARDAHARAWNFSRPSIATPTAAVRWLRSRPGDWCGAPRHGRLGLRDAARCMLSTSGPGLRSNPQRSEKRPPLRTA